MTKKDEMANKTKKKKCARQQKKKKEMSQGGDVSTLQTQVQKSGSGEWMNVLSNLIML